MLWFGMIINKVKHKFEIFLLKRNWRKQNSHNFTTMMHEFDPNRVHVGNKTYGALTVYTFNETNNLYIGNYCSIGPYVQFILSADHFTRNLSTYPFKAKYGIQKKEGMSKGDIVIEDDVWIGTNAIILSGVHIGQGAIVAAGAVVNKDVEPYAIVGGVPAKMISYRFPVEIREKIVNFDFSKLNRELVLKNIDALYSPVTEDNVDSLLKMLDVD